MLRDFRTQCLIQKYNNNNEKIENIDFFFKYNTRILTENKIFKFLMKSIVF